MREGALDTHIFTINPDGSGLDKISTRPFGDSDPAWSPDGKNIAFVRQRGEKGPNTVYRQSCIYKIKVDGTGLNRLTGTKRFAHDPAWSPYGKKIAFSQVVRRPGPVEIFEMNATDGSQKRNLTNTPLQESEPDWYPDGKKIAYTSFTEVHGAHDRVFTMNADGSDQTNLTKLKDGFSPAWLPNGKKIAFVRVYPTFPNLDIFVMKDDGTEVKRLTKTRDFDGSPDWQPLP